MAAVPAQDRGKKPVKRVEFVDEDQAEDDDQLVDEDQETLEEEGAPAKARSGKKEEGKPQKTSASR